MSVRVGAFPGPLLAVEWCVGAMPPLRPFSVSPGYQRLLSRFTLISLCSLYSPGRAAGFGWADEVQDRQGYALRIFQVQKVAEPG